MGDRDCGVARYLAVFPPFFWLVVFFLLPLLFVVVFSFGRSGAYGGAEAGFTLKHYADLLDPLYMKVLLRSLATAGVSTLLTLSVGFPMAYFLAFSPDRLKPYLLFLVILPFFTNLMVRLYSITALLGDAGWINGALVASGLVGEPVRILNTKWAVYLGFLYWNLPFMVFPIFASLDRMDVSRIEASMDLGAGRVGTFLRITLPHAMPGLVAGVIFCFVPTLGCFIIPEVLGGKSDVMVGNVITDQFMLARNWPFGSAMSAVLISLIMVFVFLYLRFGDRETHG